MFIRAYLRASTKNQDADRARTDLESFASRQGFKIASFYVENESGTNLQRPELFRLLGEAHAGDVLLVEQVDRLSRLNADDWHQLRTMLNEKRIRVVSLDLPTSWELTKPEVNDLTTRFQEAMNSMMLDVLAAVARKDYDDRRRRTEQGIEKAKAEGKYKGRKANEDRNHAILAAINNGQSWTAVQNAFDCSRSTLSRLVKQSRQSAT